jgi:hypothetical protein
MNDCIERERIEKFFDGIYDCADLTFEPNDHCCAADDCAHCKWRETMNAIKKRILSIPAADVRPVVLCRDCTFFKPQQKSTRWSNTTPMCSRSATIKMPPDGFCSFGVKREKN